MANAHVTDAVECELFHLDAGTARRLRQSLVPTETAQSLAETFKVLGDPTRVRILDVLSRAELCVCDLASLVGMSESAVSHQLRLLRSMRLVRARRDGRMVFYALDDDHIVRLFNEGMRHVQESARPVER
jgi:DNA-binding transcriptional ArsR family regulator